MYRCRQSMVALPSLSANMLLGYRCVIGLSSNCWIKQCTVRKEVGRWGFGLREKEKGLRYCGVEHKRRKVVQLLLKVTAPLSIGDGKLDPVAALDDAKVLEAAEGRGDRHGGEEGSESMVEMDTRVNCYE
jgi:hypothetical protein